MTFVRMPRLLLSAGLEPFDCSQWCTPLIQECNWTKYWTLYGYQCNGGRHGLAPNGT